MLINSQVNLTKWQHRYNKNSKLYLIEGDSWVLYPAEKSNIINPYDLSTTLSDKLDIYNFGMFGDTIRNMSNESNLKYIKDRLSYILHSDTHSKTVAGMLISGGGNDLFDNLKSLLKSSSSDNPEDYINEEKLGEFFTITKSYFIKFIDGCKQFLNEDVKYFLHTYDYVTDIGDGYKSWFTTIKPWAYSKMKSLGIEDKELCVKILKIIVDKFCDMLIDIKNNYTNVYVIDLRGTLELKDWENEIHPNKEGFIKLSNKIYEEIKKI